MLSTAFHAPDNAAALSKHAQLLGGYIADPSHGCRLHVTLNSNMSTIVEGTSCRRNRPEDMRDALYKVYCGLNKKTFRKPMSKVPRSALWRGWAFLEGWQGYTAKGVTLHWHIIIGPGPGISPEQYADMMTQNDPFEPILCVRHIRDLWEKRYPRGTCGARFIRSEDEDEGDLPWTVHYAMKDALYRGPHQRRAYEMAQPLPFK